MSVGLGWTRLVLPALALLASCGAPAERRDSAGLHYLDRTADLYSIALRFAPVLYLNEQEPCKILAVIPIHHPSRPLVAYHIFFDDDLFIAGRGKSADHEIVWAEYDPVSLKLSDLYTLWHRTVLRTDVCVMDARVSGQRPKISVQWGQHGMLPLGWEALATARPRLEIMMHYELSRYLNRIPKVSARQPAVSFSGSYFDYVRFTTVADASDYIHAGDVIAIEHSAEYLHARVGETFSAKKEWPDW